MSASPDFTALAGWPASALVTALTVFALQRLLRSRGGEFAGLVASAPLTSAPALLWLSQARGPADAAEAATAGLHLTAAIALVLLALLGLVPRTWRDVPRRGDAAPADSALPDACGALCAGVVTGACLAAGTTVSAAVCGVLACLPWTGLCAFACSARLHGRGRARSFLRGYAQGLLPRLVFFGSVAALVPALGGPLAVMAGLAAGGAVLVGQRRFGRWNVLRRPVGVAEVRKP